MSGGGELSIAVDRKGVDQASVTISDTGEGIAADHMEKIFEPFFSTKRRGDGTGLGLSISSRIIINHGGRIEVESAAGKGARFILYLPAADMNMLEAQPKGATRDTS